MEGSSWPISRQRISIISSTSIWRVLLRLVADTISELVINQELVRVAARGYGDGLNAGMVIGLPPVMNFAQEPLRSKVLEEVLSGQKVSQPCESGLA